MAPDFVYDRLDQDFLVLDDTNLLSKDAALDRVDALKKMDPLPTGSDVHVVNDSRTLRALGRYEKLPREPAQ